MSVIADVTIPADSFALGQTLAACPDVSVEVERLASHSTEWALPFLWASGDDLEAFQDAMEGDPTIDSCSVVEEIGGEVLYKVHWTDEVLGLITEMIDEHASFLEATARNERWRLKLRFAEEGQVSSFQEHFAERGYSFDVHRIVHPSAPREQEYGLTAEQREALVTALDAGYFSVPRDRSIEELSEELELSTNAVSQRIRRGSANLVRHTLTIDAGEDEEF